MYIILYHIVYIAIYNSQNSFRMHACMHAFMRLGIIRVREGTEISNSLGAMMARGLDMIMKFSLLLGGGPPSLVYVEYVL